MVRDMQVKTSAGQSEPSNGRSRRTRPLFVSVALVLLVQSIFVLSSFRFLDDNRNTLQSETNLGKTKMLAQFRDESNVVIPKNEDGSAMSLEERLRYLELKTNVIPKTIQVREKVQAIRIRLQKGMGELFS